MPIALARGRDAPTIPSAYNRLQMTTVSAPDNPKAQQAESFDPDEYRMTIGEHLEELRMRLIFGMSGFIIAAIVCLAMGEKVVEFFLRPLMLALVANKLPPVVHYTEPAESFMVYIKASLITAGAISAPWVLYQLWQFVAAGLYPRERKYITKYLPLSIGLLIGGMVFLYMFVLPIMLEFFLSFTSGKPFHFTPTAHALVVPSTTQPAVVVPTISGDPSGVIDGQIWIDASEHRMKMFFDGEIRSFP